MKILFAGSRNYPLPQLVHERVMALPTGSTVVNGLCPNSPDVWARVSARNRGLKVEDYPANWEADGRAAGHKRNARMADVCDRAEIFWDGVSPGTRGMIALMRRSGKDFTVFGPNGGILEEAQKFATAPDEPVLTLDFG